MRGLEGAGGKAGADVWGFHGWRRGCRRLAIDRHGFQRSHRGTLAKASADRRTTAP